MGASTTPSPASPMPGLNHRINGVYQEYWKYSGYGGAVYCEFNSSPKFVHCTFVNNYAKGGVSGIGGDPDLVTLLPGSRSGRSTSRTSAGPCTRPTAATPSW